MKKVIALLLAIVMVFALAACADEVPTTNDATAASQDEVTQDVNEETQPADTEAPEEVAFTEIVVVDNEECVIKITGLEPDNMWGYAVKALLENKSADKTYMFTVESAAINGVSSDPLFASEVAAGKKSNESISFMGDDLEENGVGDYTDIEMTFRVYDSEDWSADDVANETVHIYPYGEDKAIQFVREAKDTDTVLLDNEYVTAIITGYENDDIWGYTANLFFVNKTDSSVMFSVDNASINGFMADPFFATSVPAGKCEFNSMSWSDSTLEENGITSVDEIEFTIRAYSEEDWTADDFANETITVNP